MNETICDWCNRPASNPYKTFSVKRRRRKELPVPWSRLRKFGTIQGRPVYVCANEIHKEVWR